MEVHQQVSSTSDSSGQEASHQRRPRRTRQYGQYGWTLNGSGRWADWGTRTGTSRGGRAPGGLSEKSHGRLIFGYGMDSAMTLCQKKQTVRQHILNNMVSLFCQALNGERNVHFALAPEWYEKIKNGTKKVELRAASEHWRSRILGRTHAVFKKGHLPANSSGFLHDQTLLLG